VEFDFNVNLHTKIIAEFTDRKHFYKTVLPLRDEQLILQQTQHSAQ